MTFYGSLDAVFAYAVPRTDRPIAVHGHRGSLDELIGGRVRALSDILKDIQTEIASRTQLSYLVLRHIDTYYCYLKSELHDLYRWPLGHHRSIDQRRIGIEKLLHTLHTEKRRELTQCWQDIARLRSEFRTWLKQYSDLIQRARLVLRTPATPPKEDPD